MKPVWRHLTAPGPGAVSVLALEGLTERQCARLEAAFRPGGNARGRLRYGWLLDDAGATLDEILLEKSTRGYLLHLHGGVITTSRVQEMLASWGLKGAVGEPVLNLEGEILYALAAAPTELAARTAVGLLTTLPTVTEPGNLLASLDYGRSLFCPRQVVLVGAANAGKSSLLNRLAGQERAVVSEVAGTTRDLLSVSLEIDGRQVRILDGAGLRDSDDELERSGQDLIRAAAAQTAALWVVNPLAIPKTCPVPNPIAVVYSHGDKGLGPKSSPGALPQAITGLGDQGEGVRQLLADWLPKPISPPFIFTDRQRDVIQEAINTRLWDPQKWLGNTDFPIF